MSKWVCSVYDCWGSLLWRADDALLYIRRLHTVGCGVNRRRWLVRSYGSSHGNYNCQRGCKQGHIKCVVIHAHYKLHTEYMAESVNMSCQDERENGLNKAYPYGKQAQVQCINLAWMNEIGKRMWHKVYKENNTLGNCRRPPFVQTMRTNSVLTTYFPYKITTIYIQ